MALVREGGREVEGATNLPVFLAAGLLFLAAVFFLGTV